MSSQQVVDILLAAKDRVIDGWCQRYAAIDATGRAVYPTDDGAVAWCTDGALCAAVGSLKMEEGLSGFLITAHSLLFPSEIGIRSYIGWNDDAMRTKDQVIGLYDEAIGLAKNALPS